MNLEIISNIADIVAIPIALISVFLVVHQLYLTRIQNENEYKRRKKELTLNAYNIFREEIRELTYKINNKLNIRNMNTILNKNHIETIYENNELKHNVVKMLSLIERLAVGVKHDIYDIYLINDLSGKVLRQTFEQYKLFIQKARNNHPTFYIEYENLVNELMKIKNSKDNKTLDDE